MLLKLMIETRVFTQYEGLFTLQGRVGEMPVDPSATRWHVRPDVMLRCGEEIKCLKSKLPRLIDL